jgi:hypothetical protein
MSVLVIKIKDKGKINPLRKLVKSLYGQSAYVLTDEEYRDSKFLQLMAEGRKTGTLSDAEAKKALKKRGIKI